MSRRALVAASQPVDDPQQIFTASGLGGRRNDWQADAWRLYRQVGELRYYVGWRSSSCSRVRLVASAVDPVTGLPTGSVADDDRDGQRFAEIVRSIAGGPLGQSQIVKRAAALLTVPGELWIAILMRPEGERWFAVARKEIERGTRGDSVMIKLPDGSKHEFDPAAGDGMFRVWEADEEDASVPTSAVQSCLDPLREIVRTTRKIDNADMSRLINNGILFIPHEASLPAADGPTAAAGAAAAGGGVKPTTSTQLQHLIVQAAETVTRDANAMAALVPIVAAVPGDQIDKINHVTFGKDVTDIAIKTRNDAISRLAMGLNMSPEQLLGLSQGNHWSAFAIGDQDVQLHIAPVMETICQAIYERVLAGMLTAAGIDPSRYVLWYDTSRLTADPDLRDEAQTAYAAGAISTAKYVQLSGLPEDALYDLTTLEGWQVWARDAVTKDPTLFMQFLPLLDASLQALDFPEPVPALPAGGGPGDSGGGGVPSGAQRGAEPDTEGDAPPAGQATVGDGVELAVVDLLVGRALELAGKRRRSRPDHARLREVPMHETHRYMAPVPDVEADKLIAGWDAALADGVLSRMGLDAERVRAAVQRAARRELTAAVLDAEVC